MNRLGIRQIPRSVRILLTRSLVLALVIVGAEASLSVRQAAAQWEGREKVLDKLQKTFGDPKGMVRLDKVSRVWADKKKSRVVVDGYIALRVGQLEMFACPVGTKEHESVVAVFSKAQVVHAGLLAVGAKVGTPVSWDPEYKAPTGSEIRVFVLWKDNDGKKHSTDALRWVRKVGTESQTLETNFVFAGSMMWQDPDTGEQKYMAESGDLICVSNFSTATLDVPIKSSQVNSGLLFAAFTDRIPEEGTPVRLVLQVVEPKSEGDRVGSQGKTSNGTEKQKGSRVDGGEKASSKTSGKANSDDNRSDRKQPSGLKSLIDPPRIDPPR